MENVDALSSLLFFFLFLHNWKLVVMSNRSISLIHNAGTKLNLKSGSHKDVLSPQMKRAALRTTGLITHHFKQSD